jgi:hypothetical protein
VARWKEGGSARGAGRRGGLATTVTSDSSLPMIDFTGEVDTRQCCFAVKVAAWFALAGVAWSRRRKRGSLDDFPVKVESDEEGETGPVWVHHEEEKKMPPPPGNAHARALGGGGDNGAPPMEVGGSRDKGGAPEFGTGRRKKIGAWAAPGGRLMG